MHRSDHDQFRQFTVRDFLRGEAARDHSDRLAAALQHGARGGLERGQQLELSGRLAPPLLTGAAQKAAAPAGKGKGAKGKKGKK